MRIVPKLHLSFESFATSSSFANSIARSSPSPLTTSMNLPLALEGLTSCCSDHWSPHQVRRISVPEPLTFHRDYVARSTPVVVTGAVQTWKSMISWSLPHLARVCGDREISVNYTPDGRADAVKFHDGKRVFVKPEERKLTMSAFVADLQAQEGEGVPYISRQNDSLRTEFPCMATDVPARVDFAATAFGNDPEAVNLWVSYLYSYTLTSMNDYYR